MRDLRVVRAAAVALAALGLVWSGATPAAADEGSSSQQVQQLTQQVQQEKERLDQLTSDADRAQNLVARKNQELRSVESRKATVHAEMQAVARIEYQRPALTLNTVLQARNLDQLLSGVAQAQLVARKKSDLFREATELQRQGERARNEAAAQLDRVTADRKEAAQLLSRTQSTLQAAQAQVEAERQRAAQAQAEAERVARAQAQAAQEQAARQQALAAQAAQQQALAAQAAQQQALAAQQQAQTVARQVQAQVAASGCPIGGATLTQPFGPSSFEGYHTGVDLAAPAGTPIHAVAGGTATAIPDDGSGYGNHVTIQVSGDRTDLYGHMSSIAVSSGQAVTPGQVIGYEGSTGFSSGPHLHYEVRMGGTAVDPTPFYQC
jgi:murein DD-endopeptidase MepM/ murein hydrolase activator NlpD